MSSMRVKTAILILIVGLLSACGSRPADAPASPPTDEVAAPTQAPTNPPAPSDTALPTDTAQPIDTPVTEPAAQAGSVSFANDVFPILQSRCVNCHGGDRIEKGPIMRTYAELMAGSDNGDGETSLLAELIATQKMPKRGPKLTAPQVQVIIDWSNQGALNN